LIIEIYFLFLVAQQTLQIRASGKMSIGSSTTKLPFMERGLSNQFQNETNSALKTWKSDRQNKFSLYFKKNSYLCKTL
jgi:hypothetical protein